MISNSGQKNKPRRLNNIQIKNICSKNRKRYDKRNELINYNDEIFHHERECFICLELELYIDNSRTIKLNKMEDYIKKCSCDGWIHEHCFSKWHNVNKYCPICRSVIIFTRYEYCIIIIHKFKKYTSELFILLCKLIKQTLLYSMCLWSLYYIYINFFNKTPMLSN
jgi:hypothetical protein